MLIALLSMGSISAQKKANQAGEKKAWIFIEFQGGGSPQMWNLSKDSWNGRNQAVFTVGGFSPSTMLVLPGAELPESFLYTVHVKKTFMGIPFLGTEKALFRWDPKGGVDGGLSGSGAYLGWIGTQNCNRIVAVLKPLLLHQQ